MSTAVEQLLKEARAHAERDVARFDAALKALNGKGGAGRKPASKPPKAKVARKKASHITPKGLKRIRAAQKARWAAYHAQQAQLAKEA